MTVRWAKKMLRKLLWKILFRGLVDLLTELLKVLTSNPGKEHERNK